MFYENLYEVLGKLFYSAASADGIVHESEKEKLQLLLQNNWKPLENSADEHGTDLSNHIEFAFDFEETETINHKGLEEFEDFYRQNKNEFTPEIKDNILRTIHAINMAYYGENKKEEKLFNHVEKLCNS